MARTGAAELLVWQGVFVTLGEKKKDSKERVQNGNAGVYVCFDEIFKANLLYCIV